MPIVGLENRKKTRMDFTILLFISVAVILLIETRLSAKWSPFYFKRGIQVYSREINAGENENFKEISSQLNRSFKGTGYWPSIHFYQIDSQTIGFREKLIEFSLFNYTPIMHGRIEKNNKKFKVFGYANWFPIGFITVWYSSLLPNFNYQMHIMFLIFPALLFGAIYAMQSNRYSKVARQLADIK